MEESWTVYQKLKRLLRDTGLRRTDRLVIFDVCSGKGFTAALLSAKFPNSDIWMLDKNTE
jgi:methylase of polypeptide subunit release factors